MPILAHLLVLAAIVVVVILPALLLRLWKPVLSAVFSLQAIPSPQVYKLHLIAGFLSGPPAAIGHTSDRQFSGHQPVGD